MLRLSASIIAVLSASAFGQPVSAEEAFDVEAYDDSRAIIVTGISDGYLATNSVTATKTDTRLIDIPQTINVVTRAQLDDQAHHSLADILRYIPGTTVGQGEGNRDQITLRGQNTTADFFLDGVRVDGVSWVLLACEAAPTSTAPAFVKDGFCGKVSWSGSA